MKTAVEQLLYYLPNSIKRQFKEQIEQAKEMEKERHKQTWLDSTAQFDNAAEMTYKKDFEQYYNETFNQQEQ